MFSVVVAVRRVGMIGVELSGAERLGGDDEAADRDDAAAEVEERAAHAGAGRDQHLARRCTRPAAGA